LSNVCLFWRIYGSFIGLTHMSLLYVSIACFFNTRLVGRMYVSFDVSKSFLTNSSLFWRIYVFFDESTTLLTNLCLFRRTNVFFIGFIYRPHSYIHMPVEYLSVLRLFYTLLWICLCSTSPSFTRLFEYVSVLRLFYTRLWLCLCSTSLLHASLNMSLFYLSLFYTPLWICLCSTSLLHASLNMSLFYLSFTRVFCANVRLSWRK